jgi:hypothetical protein
LPFSPEEWAKLTPDQKAAVRGNKKQKSDPNGPDRNISAVKSDSSKVHDGASKPGQSSSAGEQFAKERKAKSSE